MNRATALEAHKLYTAISEAAQEMKLRIVDGHLVDLGFRVSMRPNVGSTWTQMAELSDLKNWGVHQEVAAFAIRRLNEERQKKVNEWGRRLAQLGFEKPEVCK